MNKYLSLLFICSGSALYGQNPPENSMFEQNLSSANELYKTLTEDEKTFCDLAPRRLAVLHARALRDENKQNLIPVDIGADEDENAIDLQTASAVCTLRIGESKIPDDKWPVLAKISAIRISAPFKNRADLVGEKPTWSFFEHQNFEDPNYFDTNK